MNTANWIPDLFMKRVFEEKEWTLFSPDEVPESYMIDMEKHFEKAYIAYEEKAAYGQNSNISKKFLLLICGVKCYGCYLKQVILG